MCCAQDPPDSDEALLPFEWGARLYRVILHVRTTGSPGTTQCRRAGASDARGHSHFGSRACLAIEHGHLALVIAVAGHRVGRDCALDGSEVILAELKLEGTDRFCEPIAPRSTPPGGRCPGPEQAPTRSRSGRRSRPSPRRWHAGHRRARDCVQGSLGGSEACGHACHRVRRLASETWRRRIGLQRGLLGLGGKG